jgi:tRNA A-37 threonylcarbamoyl transferase component Bud32
LRDRASKLIELPWELPLAAWPASSLNFRDLPVGPSRHLVRFLVVDGLTFALKEEPLEVATDEFDVLRHLEDAGLPAVLAVGLAAVPERDSAILITEYLAYSIQYRRLLMRFPLGPGPYRDRLLDAMASLLVDLHRAGVYWGDCSLANTLFRRDGDKIQAYLVDAETSEIHPALSDGQRAYDLDILVENVAFGLADLAAMQDRPEGFEDAVAAAETVRTRYCAVWEELHLEPELSPGDRHAIRARIRRLNELGFAIDELVLEPTEPSSEIVRLRVAVANRRFHGHELQKLTGLVALEGQARLLLNDLREYQGWLEHQQRKPISTVDAAARWLEDVLEPSLAALVPAIGPLRDPLQAYCDVLEEKWLLSEAAGHDVGLEAAMTAYLDLGAPAPEAGTNLADSSIALDIDWSGGLDQEDSG